MLSDENRLEAKAAGLRYTLDSSPGLHRKRVGRGFVYLLPDGERVTQPEMLSRIRSLAIPPAWREVWISPYPNGHLQATGRDQKGRKQAIYHPAWRAHRDETKFHRMREFGLALPAIRAAVEHDFSLKGLPKRKVVAAVVRLLEGTLIRVGNRQYAIENGSYGLTTLSVEHAEVAGARLVYRYKGKSGRFHEVEYRDHRIARLVRQCQDMPGQALFQYVAEDGEFSEVESADVNQYLQEVTGERFTAKDFRTWTATVEALRLLRESQGQMSLTAVVRAVADRLGNTPAVCRRSYIYPALLQPDSQTQEWLTRELSEVREDGLEPLEGLLVDCVLSR